jgi:hypothetical protein
MNTYSNTNENTNVNAYGYVHTWGPILAFQKAVIHRYLPKL